MLPKCVLSSRLPVLRTVAIVRSLHCSPATQSGHEYWWAPEKNAGREVVGHGLIGDEVCHLNALLLTPIANFSHA